MSAVRWLGGVSGVMVGWLSVTLLLQGLSEGMYHSRLGHGHTYRLGRDAEMGDRHGCGQQLPGYLFLDQEFTI